MTRDKVRKAKRPRPDDGAWRDDWNTPIEELEMLRKHLGPVVLDPCWNRTALTNPTIAAWTDCPDDELRDGRAISWGAELDKRLSPSAMGGFVFVNPPYSDLGPWLAKCADEAPEVCRRGFGIVALVPARVEQPAWTDIVHSVDAIGFRKGRITFDHPEGERSVGCGFPVAMLGWFRSSRAERFMWALLDSRRWWVTGRPHS